MGSASASASAGLISLSWTADATSGGQSFAYVQFVVTGYPSPSGSSTSLSGSEPFTCSGSISWSVYANYQTFSVLLGSGTVQVPPPPPAPPAPAAPTGLTVTDNTSSVALGWTAVTHPSGTTITYEVQRAGTTIATGLTSPSYTDTAPGSSRPVTYQIRAKSVGDGSTYTGTTYSDYATVQTNGTPLAPTLVSPPDASGVNTGGVTRFRWTPGFPTSTDSQSKFTIAFSSDGGTTWTETTISNPNAFYDAVAGTFTAGAWQWRVKVFGSSGIEGPYSTTGHFTAAAASTDLSITYPASGAYMQQADRVDWSVADQIAYRVRRVGDNNGAPNTGTLYFDSGEVDVGGARTLALTFDVNGRAEHVQVQTKNAAGVWDDWADQPVFVAYTPPPAALVYAEPIVTDGGALIRYHLTTPQPGAGVPPATSAIVAARPVGATTVEWQRGATTVLPPNGFVDFTHPNSGIDYEVQVTTVAENGITTSTDWMR
jgi:hypothetical protein